MPTTYCQPCERLIEFDPAEAVEQRELDYKIDPPGVHVHAPLACGHSKAFVTVLPAEEVAAA